MFMKIVKISVLAASLAIALGATGLYAQGPKFFRIGTGGTAGTYYPVGGVLANAISNPPGLILTAVASNGSVANVNSIVGGQLESGFSQSDVAYWAFTGTGVFEGKPKVEELRAIANLYPESIHLVVRKNSGISTVADLRGKRVSLDEPGSGTLVDARIILNGWGVKEADIKPEYVKPNQAAEKMKDGALDAFFFVGGFPAAAITEIAASGPGIDLVPIDGPNADKIRGEYKFFARDEVPSNTYKGVEAVRTLSVGAQWITSAKISADTVYEVTKGLWSSKTRQALDAGHAKGKSIREDTALSGIGIPLHPGAERFYKEAGLLK
jgi:TRAP transporter TAXI family solute receptor